MKTLSTFLAMLLIALSVVVSPSALSADKEYSFKVHNKTDQVITGILVSENKSKWGKFDIGKGIPGGATVKLVWAASTNDEECKQWVKALYSDGSESKPAKFDFCEDDLEIEFE